MKLVKVSELKAHLSAYLAEVRRGDTVVVCDRHTPIARLVPIEDPLDGLVIVPPIHEPAQLRRIKPVRPNRAVDVVQILREDRDQR